MSRRSIMICTPIENFGQMKLYIIITIKLRLLINRRNNIISIFLRERETPTALNCYFAIYFLEKTYAVFIVNISIFIFCPDIFHQQSFIQEISQVLEAFKEHYKMYFEFKAFNYAVR